MQPFKKVIFIGAALLLIAALFTTAQADYLGPNRVIVTYETIYQRQACRFVDVRDPAGPGVCACTMTVYVGPKDSCPGSVDSHYFHTDVCGWSSENPDCTDAGLDSISGPSSSIQSCSLGDQACTAVVIEHRTTLAAATVSGAITCSTPGQNGWCVGPAFLNASGSEPLSGYSILTLEGTRNGESFACPGDHCSNVPLSEGSNDFQFWAISSYGDSSAMGSASASVDTQAPTISGSLSGTQGENGWYTSAVTLSAAATDPTPGSGIASFEVSADGAAWQPCSGSLTLGDGVHTVSLRTADAAGWTASAEQTFSVDTQAPQLSADLAGHLVSPGRYNTTATLSASGSDTGSGLNRIEYQDNSGGWTTYTDPLVFYNGQHEIEVRAVDQAGLTSDVQTFSFFVESRGPYITVPDHWQVGQTISLSVQANSFSLGSVSIVVSDPQQRWPDVEQVYPASGDSFTTDFHWDGQFNGQTAPAGQYTVSVYASDVMSNLSVSHSQVTIPVVIPTAVPTLTATGTVAAAESTTAAAATATPQPSSTPTAVVAGVPVTSFSSPASPATQPAATLPSNVLWGGAAAAVIGAATAAALEAARKRKEEEEAQRQAAEAAAAQFNAAEKGIDALIAANQDSQWLMQQWLGSQGLPTSYPTQAALVAAYDAAREAEKQKAKEQEALNDAYQSFKQADQQSMQEYEVYREKQREAEISGTVGSAGSHPVPSLTYNSASALTQNGVGTRIANGLPATFAGGYEGSVYGALEGRLYETITQKFISVNTPENLIRGFIHEDLWMATNNSNPISVAENGIAWLNKSRTTPGFDGKLITINDETNVQLKSINPNIETLARTENRYSILSTKLGPDAKLLISDEEAGAVAAKSSVNNVSSSEVSCEEAQEVANTLKNSVLNGNKSEGIALAGKLAVDAGTKAGIVGAAIQLGVSGVEDVIAVKNGTMSKQTAVADTTVDVAGAFASAFVGAAAGAAVCSIIPGLGTIGGALVGFGVSLVASGLVQYAWNALVHDAATSTISSALESFWK